MIAQNTHFSALIDFLQSLVIDWSPVGTHSQLLLWIKKSCDESLAHQSLLSTRSKDHPFFIIIIVFEFDHLQVAMVITH